MATAPLLVSEAEYLHTSYRPDCDYIDGVVLERNLGQYSHARLQMLVLTALHTHEADWNIQVLPELRLRIRPGKYRIPDIMVLPAGVKHPPVIENPPLLCIEIVSPDDRLHHLTERAQDYATLGVPETWILDPENKKAFVYRDGLHQIEPPLTVLRRDPITLDLEKLFAAL